MEKGGRRGQTSLSQGANGGGRGLRVGNSTIIVKKKIDRVVMFEKLLGLARRITLQAEAIVCSHSPLILMIFDLSGCSSGPRRSVRERLNRVHPELLQNKTTIILAEGMVNRSLSP